jgi:hypothetical protein
MSTIDLSTFFSMSLADAPFELLLVDGEGSPGSLDDEPESDEVPFEESDGARAEAVAVFGDECASEAPMATPIPDESSATRTASATRVREVCVVFVGGWAADGGGGQAPNGGIGGAGGPGGVGGMGGVAGWPAPGVTGGCWVTGGTGGFAAGWNSGG